MKIIFGAAGYGMMYHAGKKTGKTDNDDMVDDIVAAVEEKAELLVEQVASLRTTQNSSLMQEVLQMLHMALSVQGASLLPSSVVSGLVAALQVLLPCPATSCTNCCFLGSDLFCNN